MAELADALDSGSSSRKAVEVQVLSTAPYETKPSIIDGSRVFSWEGASGGRFEADFRFGVMIGGSWSAP